MVRSIGQKGDPDRSPCKAVAATAVDGEEISRAWMLYHLVEHFAHHRGQIALLEGLRKSSTDSSDSS